jgi:hypothetical protein
VLGSIRVHSCLFLATPAPPGFPAKAMPWYESPLYNGIFGEHAAFHLRNV